MNQPHLFRGFSNDVDMFIIGYYSFDSQGRLFIKDATLLQEFEVVPDSLGVHCDGMVDCEGTAVFASYNYNGKYSDVLESETYSYYIVCEGSGFIMMRLDGEVIERDFITYYDILKGVLK